VDLYEDLARRLLFRIPADTAHELAKTALRRPTVARAFVPRRWQPDPRLQTSLAGLRLRSPIGLAPGFDKSGDLVPGLARLGFGYVTVGSITTAPRAGNPKPRLVRYADRQSVANCMGMPNDGLEQAVRYLSRPRPTGTKVIAAVAGFSVDELLAAAAAVEPHVDAVEIGLVCRHTPETFEMAELPAFVAIAEGVARQKTKPTFAKLPPHHTPAELARTLSMVDVCLSGGFDGVSLSGTRQIPEPRLSMGQGGLAGRATTADARRILADVARRAEGRLTIKASGGVFDGHDAYAFLELGATAVEVYSAFIYRGWGVARKLASELADELDRRGLDGVSAIPAAGEAPLPAIA
jgi:dihydroorotate dehydrogenase (fumarate)/dihydroorotate dehydrogenase